MILPISRFSTPTSSPENEETRMSNPLVSLVVLNWNGESLLRECIESLQGLNYSPVEIIVVDNASTDGSIALLESIKGISIVKNSVNLGYAGGINAGIRAATGVYVAALNNDIIFDPFWLGELVSILESDSSIGIISGRQMNYYHRETIDALYSYLHPSLIFFQEGFGKRWNAAARGATPARVFGVSGASTVYRKKMFDELGGLDETLFAYHEESDLCMKSFLSGWKCVYVPAASAYHKRSVTFNRVKNTMIYYHTRNRLWFIYKYSPLSLVMTNLFWIIFTELRIFRIALFREKVLLSYLKGLADGFKGMKLFAKKRKLNLAMLKMRRKEYERLRKKKFIPL
jgi:GT2 family glycosyltransferase